MTLDQIKRVANLADDSEFATDVARLARGVLRRYDRKFIKDAIGKLFQDVPEEDGEPMFVSLTRDEAFVLATLAWFGRHEAAVRFVFNETGEMPGEKGKSL